jgi:hypothetical protein
MFLFNAVLNETNLTGVDLSDAAPPVIADLDIKILNALNAGGTLDMDNWQTGEKAFSRGGWAIHLAGEAGTRLETTFGAHVAAGLIYAAAYPQMRVPDFYASNADALHDMQRRAAAGPPVHRLT